MSNTPPHILLIDDDLYIRDVYKEVLESEGFQVSIAIDGKEGLEKITSESHSLILLDVMLPQLDGIGVLATLSEQKISHPPVILLTNLAHDPIIKDATKYGALMTLIKTDITPDQLVDHVKQVLKIPASQKTEVATSPEKAPKPTATSTETKPPSPDSNSAPQAEQVKTSTETI